MNLIICQCRTHLLTIEQHWFNNFIFIRRQSTIWLHIFSQIKIHFFITETGNSIKSMYQFYFSSSIRGFFSQLAQSSMRRIFIFSVQLTCRDFQ